MNSAFLVCSSCGERSGIDSARTTCASCGGLFDVEHPVAQSGCDLKGLFDVRARDSLQFSAGAERSGVWRYRELVMPAPLGEVVSYPEGNTALLERAAIASFAEVPALLLKHEGMNPTGSFKDRGMSVALTQAKLTGASAVACASTGNTSSSLAAYAGMAGIPSLVLVPSGLVSAGKLAQTVACGARTLLVRGDFDDCLRLVREAGEHLGVYLVNSVNPFRIEGQKTIVFEMIQQLGWESPDWIALPAGNLGNAAAFGKAIRELKERDIIAKVPRLLLVQAEGAAPFVRSFRDEFRVRHRIHANTVATAIRIGDPASYDRAVRSVRETDGVVTDVTDDEILEAMGVINSSGVGCEPASAASVAGVRKMVAAGVIPAGARVVAVLTGHLLKDAGVTMSPGRSKETGAPRQPVEVDPTLAAVEAALRG